MIERRIITSKTARFYCTSEDWEACTSVWIVLHGYGQLAKYFIRKFEVVATKQRLIVAPEAPHRFYLDGTHGRVGASWMTKEDRLTDIEDYVNYLDLLAHEILDKTDKPISINVVGFSQGASTAVRWACMGKHILDRLIIWAGAFPPDINFATDVQHLNKSQIDLVFGTKDQYYQSSQVEEIMNLMGSNGIEFRMHEFDGNHDIDSDMLNQLLP